MISKIFNRIAALYTKHEYSFVLGFVLIWQTVLLATANGKFVETDSYTHALRLMDMIESGSWQEILYRHDNCPFGQMLHFTRITDMFLFLTVLPFRPFMELKQAIVFGGFLYNPLIACLSAVALIWAGRTFLTPLLRAAVVFCYFGFPVIVALFLAGRPDHHVLLNLLLIMLCGCLLHGAKTQKTAYYKLAGIFGGLAVWATPEGFLACIFLFAGMVAAWLCRYQNIRQIRFFSQFLFITTAVCLIVNPPMQGIFHPDNGRLSILMVVVLGLSFVSFYIEEFLEKKSYIRSFFRRLASLSFLGLMSFGFIFSLFDGDVVFSSPIPPELYEIWTRFIVELQPGYTGNLFTSYGNNFFFALIAGFIAFWPASLQMRKLLLTFCLPLLLFALITLVSLRFERTGHIYFVFALVPILFLFLKHFPFSKKISLLILPLLAYFYIAALFACHKAQIFWQNRIMDPAEYSSYISPKNECILTLTNRGPEIAWGTGKAVIGSPYHSNAEGIIDAYNILQGTDINRVRTLLKKRHIGTIILDNPKYWARQINAVIVEGTETFAGKIVSELQNFCFLRQVTHMQEDDMQSPEDIVQKNLIFYVDFRRCASTETNQTE